MPIVFLLLIAWLLSGSSSHRTQTVRGHLPAPPRLPIIPQGNEAPRARMERERRRRWSSPRGANEFGELD